jgi:hypothetical protein
MITARTGAVSVVDHVKSVFPVERNNPFSLVTQMTCGPLYFTAKRLETIARAFRPLALR